jgi:hypothetical protein
MPAHTTICKGLNEAQTITWEKALNKAQMSKSDALERALRMFVEDQGIEWPATLIHGGARVTKDELCRLLTGADDTSGHEYRVTDIVRDEVIDYAVKHGYIERRNTPGGYTGRFVVATQAGILWHWNNR